MEKVLEAGEEFHELRDIIARWDTLTATHQVSALNGEYVVFKVLGKLIAVP